MKDTVLRSLVKGMSWRVVATVDTIFLSLLLTGNIFSAVKIGLGEVFTKTILYFFHERVWNRVSNVDSVSKGTSLLKGISWRFFGTLDTFLVALLFTNETVVASQIAIFEIVTKLVLYYFHERSWEKLGWGKTDFSPKATTLEDCMNCQ